MTSREHGVLCSKSAKQLQIDSDKLLVKKRAATLEMDTEIMLSSVIRSWIPHDALRENSEVKTQQPSNAGASNQTQMTRKALKGKSKSKEKGRTRAVLEVEMSLLVF